MLCSYIRPPNRQAYSIFIALMASNLANYILLSGNLKVQKHGGGRDGKKMVRCPVCKSWFTLPKNKSPTQFLRHWSACSTLLVAAPLIPMGQVLSQLTISETPRTLMSGASSATSTTPVPTSERSSCSGAAVALVHQAPANLSVTEHPCPGFVVQLDRALKWYPHACHQDKDMGWFPIKFDKNGQDMTIQSTRCAGTTVGNQPCLACTLACNSQDLQVFLDRIAEAPEHTPYHYLSWEQLLVLVQRYQRECTHLQTTVRPCSSQIQTISHFMQGIEPQAVAEDSKEQNHVSQAYPAPVCHTEYSGVAPSDAACSCGATHVATAHS